MKGLRRAPHRFYPHLLFFFIIGCTIFLSAACRSAGYGHQQREPGSRDTLRVTAVQFDVTEKKYSDIGNITREVETLVRWAVEENGSELIVFPEYTAAFLALLEYSDIFSQVTSFVDGIKRISGFDPDITGLFSLFSVNSGEAEKLADTIFGGAAEKYGVFIAAGTMFKAISRHNGKKELRNRLLVYGPTGELIYTQDKVYLTPFEADLLRLSPGALPEDPGITIGDADIVFTICRDSFFQKWNSIYGDADLWIDMKANGVRYTEEEEETFFRAMPSRLAEAGVPYGLTVCLTGELTDLFWEGETALWVNQDGTVRREKVSRTVTNQEIINLTLPVLRE